MTNDLIDGMPYPNQWWVCPKCECQFDSKRDALNCDHAKPKSRIWKAFEDVKRAAPRFSRFNREERHDIVCGLSLLIQHVKEDGGEGSRRLDRICDLLNEVSNT